MTDEQKKIEESCNRGALALSAAQKIREKAAGFRELAMEEHDSIDEATPQDEREELAETASMYEDDAASLESIAAALEVGDLEDAKKQNASLDTDVAEWLVDILSADELALLQ